ncbi:MAG TPA: HEAT repeat domain-containing protein [Planctomycetota bacterium]|nr:HEAT repeat domain-containing protein [Planctomycetota bacterium]
MRSFALVAILASVAVAGQSEPSVADLVARLRALDASYDDWPPIVEAGKAAVPELKKLLADRNEEVRAAAAVLLYRLGEASALDALDALLQAKDPAARKEGAEALAAFTGGPAGGGEALAAWRAWWKTNRAKALATAPLGSLCGNVTGLDDSASLVATSLSARHGARRGMRLNVRRGSEFVCLLDIVFASATGSVARMVALSERTAPKAGDACFWTRPKGE